MRGPWGAGIAWQARRSSYGDLRRYAGTGRLPANPQLLRTARQAIGRHIHFAVVGPASARIRLL